MIDEIFDALNDGQSHTFKEILGYLRSKCHVPVPSEKEVRLALSLFKEYGFVDSFIEPEKSFEAQEFWFLPKSVAEGWKNIKKAET